MYQVLLLAIFSTLLLTCYAGPAGQIALAAARASKIPRAIRASFRNPEIGVARGFGKRASNSKLPPTSTRMRHFLFGLFDNANNDSTERIRRGRMAGVKFKMSDRELRIGRGFGKRSVNPSKFIHNKTKATTSMICGAMEGKKFFFLIVVIHQYYKARSCL